MLSSLCKCWNEFLCSLLDVEAGVFHSGNQVFKFWLELILCRWGSCLCYCSEELVGASSQILEQEMCGTSALILRGLLVPGCVFITRSFCG